MELFCWEGDWGLPSIDIDCLYVAVSMIKGVILILKVELCKP